MLKHRDICIKELDLEAAIITTKYIDKQRKQEKQDRVHRSINKDLDLKDNFLGIRQLKKPYQPIPYVFTTKDRKKVNYRNRAEAAAEHLAQIWKIENYTEKLGKMPTQWVCACADVHVDKGKECWVCGKPEHQKIIKERLDYKMGEITLKNERSQTHS